MRGAIVFFILLFLLFVIYQRFPSVAAHKAETAVAAVAAVAAVPVNSPEEKEDAQENVELAASSMMGSPAAATAAPAPVDVKEGFADAAAPIAACPQPSNPPGKLPTAIYGNISDNAPRPSFDPALEPTTRARILIALDALNGFMNFEGTYMEERSDPQVQLPLSTLKADIQTLTNEALVLQRNPGLRSSITTLQINEIEANLDFLQQQYRRFDVEGITAKLK